MTESRVTLSVVIPAYNRAGIVGRAIRSVLAEGGPDVEVVVVDDGSDDETEAAVSSIHDARVRYVRIEHSGVSAARNAGAAIARGRWLAFLDSDDEVLPGWAASMVGAAAPGGAIALCGGEALDSAGHLLSTWVPLAPTEAIRQELPEKFLPAMFVVDRDIFLRCGGYVEELAFGENTELALRLLFLHASPLAIEPRVLVRRHVSTPRDVYSESRIASARYVLATHPWLRRRLPSLWASYHAILGVDAARKGQLSRARLHFVSAIRARPSVAHLGRLALATVPSAAARVWPAVPKRAGRTGQEAETVPLGRPELTGPDTTIFVVTYNYGRYLPGAIESALAQDVPVMVTVIDDGSTDDSKEVAARYGDRAEYLWKPNGGLSDARNFALARCATPYLLFLDADDRLPPEFVRETRQSLHLDLQAAFAYGQLTFFATDDDLWAPDAETTEVPAFSAERLKKGNYINSAALFRYAALAGLRYDTRLRYGLEDWEFFISLVERGAHGVLVESTSLRYRKHPTSMGHSLQRRRAVRRLTYAYILVKHRRFFGMAHGFGFFQRYGRNRWSLVKDSGQRRRASPRRPD
jgi:glycosyltransferase involved in cell wall biosynthesis